jgi:arylsulfatase A-like enzyme
MGRLLSYAFVLFVVVITVIVVFQVRFQKSINRPLCKNCNVILISLDTLGSNHLPCYGYKRDTAPNICKFAKENVFFTNSFSNASWTLPSHFSIFTSLYPKHHGVVLGDTDILSKKVTTLTQNFKTDQYDTIYVGPLLDPSMPLDKGLGRGFNTIKGSRYNNLKTWNFGLTQLLNNAKNGKKTFLFLHTYWVHSPYVVEDLGRKDNNHAFTNEHISEIPLTMKESQEFTSDFYDYVMNNYGKNLNNTTDNDFTKSIQRLKDTSNYIRAKSLYYSFNDDFKMKLSNRYYLDKISASKDKILYARDLYDESIFYLDQNFKQLFSITSHKELKNNTILIITSDHGEEFAEHGNISHPANDLFNTVTATPLIMYIPGIKQRTISNLVQSIDIAPTVLNLVGIKTPDTFEGIDLTDLILNKKYARSNPYLISNGQGIDSIRNKKWKLYVKYSLPSQDKKMKLYDLVNDPLENHNVYSDNIDIAKSLYQRFTEIIYKKKP